MKTILVDAVNGLVLEDGSLLEPMYMLLESYPNNKLVLTGANDEQFKHFKLNRVPYEVFTLKHDPEKTDPQYFKILLEKYGLKAEDVIYFEHNAEAAKTAQSVGITTYFYDHTKEDMDTLKQFLDKNLLKIQIVDNRDQLIGVKERSEVDCKTDIYRVSALWLTNSKAQSGDWNEHEMIEKDKTFTLSRINRDYHIRYTFTPVDDNKCDFEYYEWVDSDELDDTVSQDVLEKLKSVIEQA